MLVDKVLKKEEQAAFNLRSLYKGYGYQPFKMSKFEEYDLYVRNKDFLVSDRVITFNDTDGRLLALKPDVTLSIIKNSKGENLDKHKVYYSENVYRISGSTGQFKEIMQTGLECIGEIDMLDVCEVVSLAAESLALVSDEYVLDISHMGIVTAFLKEACGGREFESRVTALIAEKNTHELEALCAEYKISPSAREKLVALSCMYGERAEVLKRLDGLCTDAEARSALSELMELDKLLSSSGLDKKVRFDFSVVNNMKYYNGIVFKGFISGICEGALSGGEYDNLLHSMNLEARAIGFALYLDFLSELYYTPDEYDVDVLLLYDTAVSHEAVVTKKRELISEGKSVWSASIPPEKIRYREIVKLK
ncbi:MAG: ATP phosphoribosyltransferase regulatory subunit [Clostridia bacterium]|nr:ATP phosphoribosyltransferase regulatory subunit [Clostridia bacterium]